MKIKRFIEGMIKSNIQYIKNEFEKKQVDTQKKYDYKQLYKIVHENADPCFVLSTGRCGTALLTKIFEKHSNVDVHHEPIPELVYYSKFAYENHKNLSNEIKYLVDAARYDQIRNAFLLKKTFIETNNRITFFAYQLKELYPKANFIHLIRNPISFIKSGMARNWYTGKNPHDEGHIVMNTDTWNKYSQTEKIAWLWNETNQFIEEFKQQTEPERTLTVFAEDLFRNPQTINEIFNFLKLDTFSFDQINSLIKDPVNPGNKKKLSTINLIINKKLSDILILGELYKYPLK